LCDRLWRGADVNSDGRKNIEARVKQ